VASSSLARYALDLVEKLDDIDTRRAADAAVKVMHDATARVIGGDLRMSGLDHGGAARIESKRSGRNQVVVTMSGASYTLADKGRRRAVPARARRGSALATPFGPRASVRGSTSRGHDITDRYGPKALDKAADVIVDDLDWGR
jgi:hypothetical protein